MSLKYDIVGVTMRLYADEVAAQKSCDILGDGFVVRPFLAGYVVSNDKDIFDMAGSITPYMNRDARFRSEVLKNLK